MQASIFKELTCERVQPGDSTIDGPADTEAVGFLLQAAGETPSRVVKVLMRSLAPTKTTALSVTKAMTASPLAKVMTPSMAALAMT